MIRGDVPTGSTGDRSSCRRLAMCVFDAPPPRACDLCHIRRGALASPPIAPHTSSMEPEEFEFTDDDLAAWLDGHGAVADSNLTRFVRDLRRAVEPFSEEPSPKLSRWIADTSLCGRSDAPPPAHVVELDGITESLARLR